MINYNVTFTMGGGTTFHFDSESELINFISKRPSWLGEWYSVESFGVTKEIIFEENGECKLVNRK